MYSCNMPDYFRLNEITAGSCAVADNLTSISARVLLGRLLANQCCCEKRQYSWSSMRAMVFGDKIHHNERVPPCFHVNLRRSFRTLRPS
jgi:hypothetical protein